MVAVGLLSVLLKNVTNQTIAPFVAYIVHAPEESHQCKNCKFNRNSASFCADEAQEAEVSKVLNTLEFVYRSQRDNGAIPENSSLDDSSPLRQVHKFMAKLYLGLSMLCYILTNKEKVQSYNQHSCDLVTQVKEL